MRAVLRSTLAFALAFGVSFVAAEVVSYLMDRRAHPDWRSSPATVALFALLVPLPVALGFVVTSHAAVLAVLRHRVAQHSARAVVARAATIGVLVPVLAVALSSLRAPRNELHGLVLVTVVLTALGAAWPRDSGGAA